MSFPLFLPSSHFQLSPHPNYPSNLNFSTSLSNLPPQLPLLLSRYILDLHMARGKPVLFVGVPGTGKTTIVKDYINETRLKRDDMLNCNINHNSYTSSLVLQSQIMSALDKRTGRTYGPPNNKKCIVFVDDLNMPSLDKYDTQSAIMLLLQITSYSQIYDRERLEEKKELQDLLFVSCMNPKAGSFQVNNRLQRYYTVITCFIPTAEQIKSIYGPIIDYHVASFPNKAVKDCAPMVVSATIELLAGILNTPCFLPSAAKFHYQFNLRDCANIFQSLTVTHAVQFKDGSTAAVRFLRCWLHEAYRVFGDRLVNGSDLAELMAICERVSQKNLTSVCSKDELYAEPLIFTSFMTQIGGSDRSYLPIKDISSLRAALDDQLRQYNESFATMNLVLFEDALRHICRICRIIDLPCGHALLVGVGGSGKQSLANLSCFISQITMVRILVNQSYGMAELKLDLQTFYIKAAVKPGSSHAFLLTDGQIANEQVSSRLETN